MSSIQNRIQVQVPNGGRLIISETGVEFSQYLPGDWHMSLVKAEKVFESAARAVRVILEVNPSLRETSENLAERDYATLPGGSGGEDGGYLAGPSVHDTDDPGVTLPLPRTILFAD